MLRDEIIILRDFILSLLYNLNVLFDIKFANNEIEIISFSISREKSFIFEILIFFLILTN